MKKNSWIRRPKPLPYDEKFSAEGEFFGSRERKTYLRAGRLPKILLGMLGGVALIGLVLLLSRLWVVTEVTAEEGGFYSAAVVEEYTGLCEGDRMLGFDGFAVVTRLKDGLPLLDNIRVRKHLDGRVTVSFEEITEVYYTCHNANYYLIAARDYEVLGVFPNDSEAKRVGAVYVGMPESARVRVGEKISFVNLPYEPDSAPEDRVDYELETDEPAVENAYVFQFVKTLMASPLAERVTGMELGDRYDLWLVLDGRIKIKLGNMDELDRKLDMTVRSLADREEAGADDGSLPVLVDVSDPTRIIYRITPDIDLPAWAKGLV